MTVWPSHVPPVSTVWGFSPYLLDGDLLKLDPDAQMTSHEVPSELYLRELRELDLADPAEILSFVNTYGRLGHPRERFVRSERGTLRRYSNPVLFLSFGSAPPRPSRRQWDEWWAEIDGSPTVEGLGPFERVMFDSDGLQPIGGFIAWVKAFRQMTDLLSSYQQGLAEPGDMEDLAIALTELLGPFSPVVEVGDEHLLDRSWQPNEVSPRLESVLALQMFQHLADDDSYHVCANETHRGLFVHQRGRADHGQFRSSGVLYCSSNCAQAQAARERRRRQKIIAEEEG